MLPKSPNAASLGRFGEVPVSLYTGVPSIEVPLYTLRSRTLAVPVRLQYHGGGVRLDDVAPWVGMGWALQAGGTITHTVRGLDDLDRGGYLLANCGPGTLPVPTVPIPTNCGRLRDSQVPDYYSYIERVYAGQLDTQPDLFSFNFGSYSGKIVFNQQGDYFISPAQPLQVEFPTSTRHQWRFTDETGTQYIFRLADAEYTTTYPVNNLPVSGTPSAWYLSTIRSLSGDSVQFAYQDYKSIIEFRTLLGKEIHETEMRFYKNSMDDSGLGQRTCEAFLPGTMKDGLETVKGKLLRQISCATARLDFFSSFGRADYPSQPQLDSMQWTSRLDPLPRRVYCFGYTTYGQNQRHTLASIQERGKGTDGRWTSASPYRMDYDRAGALEFGDAYPGSPATDMWGFFNGKTANTNGFVAFRSLDFRQRLTGANRETSAEHVGYGLLQRITYPTGGTTEFTFEPHDFSNIDPRENYYEQPQYLNICDAYTDADGNPSCGNMPQQQEFIVDYRDNIKFTCTISVAAMPQPQEEPAPDPGPGIPGPREDDIQAEVWAETLDANGTPIPGANIAVPFVNNMQRVRVISVDFRPGRYRFHVEMSHHGPYAQAYVAATHTRHIPYADFFRHQGGGTRIKRIVTFDGLDHRRDMVREYAYLDSTGTRSSGRLQHEPQFNKWIKIYNPGTPTNPWAGWNTCTYLMRSAHDVMAATGTVNGSEVGYDRVTLIERGNGTAHKSVATFRNKVDVVSIRAARVLRQDTVASNDNEQNGQLLRMDDYAVTPQTDPLVWSNCRLVRQVGQRYGRFRRQALWGLSLAGNLGGYDDNSRGSGISCLGISSTSFRTYVGWYPLVRSQETLFDAQGHAYTTTTELQYDTLTHLQLTRRLVTSSSTKQELTRYKYATDYVPSLVPTLLARHYVGRPLEEQRWLLTPTDSLWLAGKVTAYAQLPGGAIVPVQEQRARLAAPSTQLPPPRRREAPFTALVPSSLYELQFTLRYKPNGQLLGQRVVGDKPSSLLWGYQDTHLLAQAVNATAVQVASTSFEPEATGRWLYDSLGGHRVLLHRSGRYGHQLDGTSAGAVRSPALPAGAYELTVWCQGRALPQLSGASQIQRDMMSHAGEWYQYRYRLTIPARASLMLTCATGQVLPVDELRLYPVGAQMTSYTFDPLDTLTSQTDPAGRTTTYEYDGLGRLVRTRDEQGRVLSQQQYHYAGAR